MSEKKIRTIPTTMVTGYWDDGSVSEYPEQIKVVMSNNRKVLYRIAVDNMTFYFVCNKTFKVSV